MATSTKKVAKKAAKKTAKKATKKATKKTTKKAASRRYGPAPDATGKQLVIVESPTKAKTINKYLGPDFVVMASVGHVRDLPARAPKGVKQEVPGVDLENDFTPTYEILATKKKTVTDLRKAAKQATDIWFATDLDREGEAIAWHLAQALGVDPSVAKRVVFNAITKKQIQEAFRHPRKIDAGKVNAQQARRILDRIVGYQVSPLLWKKVAGGLSAGRVQSVAVRLVVERELEIEAFMPDEYWKIFGIFTPQVSDQKKMAEAWDQFIAEAPDEKKGRTLKDRIGWLNTNGGLRAELVELDGAPFKVTGIEDALSAARRLGFVDTEVIESEDPKAKGPAKNKRLIVGHLGQLDPASGTTTEYSIRGIQTKRTKSRPAPPFITSSLQQSASNALGFPLKRTMRVAQQLYEGIDIKEGRGQTGLITYMRTDSTFIATEAIESARSFVDYKYGQKYLPEKPNIYNTKSKSAQEAHEAIRPTDVSLTPESIQAALTDEQFRLYQLIWKRFVGSQMVPAEWDSTAVFIGARDGGKDIAAFKVNGRTLFFDGFYRAVGVPTSGDETLLPPLEEKQPIAPVEIQPTQHFTAPPPRFNEASLQKKLEEEGIGRPSTYAAIISTIQDRRYVEPVAPRDRKLRATDLGKVVTLKLVDAFPKVMDVAYTRFMEGELDKVEEENLDWVKMLREFYGPFRANLTKAHEEMVHAKAETEPAPHTCPKCESATMYRFGRNGRFLSCTTYPDCDYAAPIDSDGNPMEPEQTNIACTICSLPMTSRSGRFGKFLGCVNYPECKGILNIDPKKGTVKLPKTPPLLIEIDGVECGKCEGQLNMRDSKRGFWLSCSKFPKCRGRGTWSTIPEADQKTLTENWEKHVAENPLPVVKTTEGEPIGDEYIPMLLGQEPDDEVDAAS